MGIENLDNTSPDFLFGQILTEIKSLKETYKEQQTQVEVCLKKIIELPCKEEMHRIDKIEEWMSNSQNNLKAKSQNTTKFKHTLIISILSSITGSLVAYLIYLLKKV